MWLIIPKEIVWNTCRVKCYSPTYNMLAVCRESTWGCCSWSSRESNRSRGEDNSHEEPPGFARIDSFDLGLIRNRSLIFLPHVCSGIFFHPLLMIYPFTSQRSIVEPVADVDERWMRDAYQSQQPQYHQHLDELTSGWHHHIIHTHVTLHIVAPIKNIMLLFLFTTLWVPSEGTHISCCCKRKKASLLST